MPITVSIVEDNEQLRETLARVLNRADGFECVGQHASAEAGLEGIPYRAHLGAGGFELGRSQWVAAGRGVRRPTPGRLRARFAAGPAGPDEL